MLPQVNPNPNAINPNPNPNAINANPNPNAINANPNPNPTSGPQTWDYADRITPHQP